jgi:hypothetical protein
VHWRHEITPVEGEPAKIGHHAANYLVAIISWADQNFLMDALHEDGCLCLPGSMQERISGFSVRQCRRIRETLERHGLIRVVAGKSGRGGGTSPRITIHFDKILDVRRPSQRREIPEVGDEAQPIRTDRPDTVQSIGTDRPHIEPTALPVRSTPRSFGRVRSGTNIPEIDRPNSVSESESRSAGATPTHNAPSCNVVPQQPSNPSTTSADDLELASPLINLWQASPKSPLARRRSVREAVRSEGDAQTVRLLASLRREGMPEELLVKTFQACLDAYTPDVDKLRSPYIHSLVWFQPWIENAADPWRRDRTHRRVVADQAHRREAASQEEESTLVLPLLTSFEGFVDRYSGRSILPPADVLCADLDGFAPDVASGHRARGSSKREILEDIRRRCRT